MELLLLIGLGAFLLSRNKPTTEPTPPVPFTPRNLFSFKNKNTTSAFNRALANAARRLNARRDIRSQNGADIVDGSYKCFAPGNQTRRADIIKVNQDLNSIETRINTSIGPKRMAARQEKREKEDERAILVAEHYMICEADLQRRIAQQAAQAAAITAAAVAAGRNPNVITTANASKATRQTMQP